MSRLGQEIKAYVATWLFGLAARVDAPEVYRLSARLILTVERQRETASVDGKVPRFPESGKEMRAELGLDLD